MFPAFARVYCGSCSLSGIFTGLQRIILGESQSTGCVSGPGAGLGGSLAAKKIRTSASRRPAVSLSVMSVMSDQDQMCEWSSVWSGKVPSKPSPAEQLMWPALTPSLPCRAAVPASCVLPGHDGETSQAYGDISDRKVVKIISSNYSRIIFIIIYFEEPMPRHIMPTKTTFTAVAVKLHHTATRGSCVVSQMAAVNFIVLDDKLQNHGDGSSHEHAALEPIFSEGRANIANPLLPTQDVQENLPDLMSPIDTFEDPQDVEEEVYNKEDPEDGEGSKGDDDTVCCSQPSPCTCVQSSGYNNNNSLHN